MIFHWRQWKWQTHFALLQEISLLSLVSFCQSRAVCLKAIWVFVLPQKDLGAFPPFRAGRMNSCKGQTVYMSFYPSQRIKKWKRVVNYRSFWSWSQLGPSKKYEFNEPLMLLKVWSALGFLTQAGLSLFHMVQFKSASVGSDTWYQPQRPCSKEHMGAAEWCKI